MRISDWSADVCSSDLVRCYIRSGDSLIEREIDFVGFICLAVGNLRHRAAKRLEVVRLRLVNEDVAVGEEQNPLLCTCLPYPPEHLKRVVGFASPRRHNEQQPHTNTEEHTSKIQTQ